MGKFKLWVFSLAGVCSIQASAQFGYHEDALRYSQSNYLNGSTARMQGFAGAQTSLGGDVSLGGTNPAGLGFYNRSSAVFSLGLDFQDSDDLFGVNNNQFTTPNFNNILGIRNGGVVMNYNKGRFTEEKFKGGSLAITFGKINDFNREYRYEGVSGTSIVDFFLDQAYLNGIDDGTLAGAAYNQFLIDFDDTTNPDDYTTFGLGGDNVISPASDVNNLDGYSSPFGAGFSEPYQSELIQERGGLHQFNVSWGGNYDDKLYFGAGLGFQTLYYKRTRDLTENDFILPDGNADPWINSIDFHDKVIARGGGINMSFGAILRPVQNITIGVSYQSPTVLNITEESDYSLSANWGNYLYYDSLGSQDYFDLSTLDTYIPDFITETKFKVKTPSKLNLGASVFVGKAGFLTADIEMVDYANAELQSDDFSPLGDNQVLKTLESVMNYRVGGEYRLDNIRLRAGIGMNQDPSGLGNDRTYTTFGIGYKSQDYFVDLAVVNTQFDQTYNPYTFGFFNLDNPQVVSSINNTTVTISAGFSF